jgi:tetratricopeptide (TPR) repeat protein
MRSIHQFTNCGYNGRVTCQPDRRSFVTVVALVFLAVALVLILRPASAPYLDRLRRGDAHAAQAERTAAVAAYEEAARLRPRDPAPYLRLAQVYLDWGRTDIALDALAEAERLGAQAGDDGAVLALPLERLSVAIHAARADWPAVVEHSQRVLALVPSESSIEGAASLNEAHTVRHTQARAYIELQDWESAQAVYEALLHADPADPVAHERLGILLLGDDPAAIQHLFAAQTDLANRLLVTMGEPGTAEDPAYASALLGQVLFEAREWALAVRQFERALSLNPEYPDAHTYLGHALDQGGHLDEARPHLLRAIALAPDSVVAHTFLGLHYDRLGDFSAARAEYETAYDLDPDNPATCVEIGQTWAAEGRYVAAEIWLMEAVSLEPNDPALWEILTRFYLDHSIIAEGRGVEGAEQLVALAPDDAGAHDLQGWAALQVGDYATAEDSLLRAISLDPTLAAAHYHLGLLRIARGAPVEAREAFVRARDLDTTGELASLIERELDQMP